MVSSNYGSRRVKQICKTFGYDFKRTFHMQLWRNCVEWTFYNSELADMEIKFYPNKICVQFYCKSNKEGFRTLYAILWVKNSDYYKIYQYIYEHLNGYLQQRKL